MFVTVQRFVQLPLKDVVQAAAQGYQRGLLAGSPQLRMLLVQAMLKTAVVLLALREKIIHRHFQPLPLRLQLTQQC